MFKKTFWDRTEALGALCQLMMGMLGALLIQVFVVNHNKLLIVKVDITGITESFVKETVNLNISSSEKEKKVAQFSQALNELLPRIAKKEHLILVPSEAVIAGSPDITLEVQKALKETIKS